MGRKTKNQLRIEDALLAKDLEEERIKEILKSTGAYTAALHPMIELYLDAYEVYYIKYLEWRDTGFKSTKRHKNISGASNEVKHPVAQQVEVWSDKKSKYLNQLGLDAKNKKLPNTGPLFAETERNKEKSGKSPKTNKLLEFNKQYKDKSGG